MSFLSQLLVVIADLLYIFSMLSKRKITLTILLFFSDMFFATHYFYLNYLTSSTIFLIDATFLLITFFIEKNENHKYIPFTVIVTIFTTIIACMFTWNGLISIIPLLSMVLYLIGMLFSNITFVKIGALCRNTLNIIYLLILKSFIGAGSEFILMLSAIIGIIINTSNQRKNSPLK